MLLRFGKFELDGPRFELRRDGKPVSVQPKVLELLIYLAEHRDRVVSKDELLERVWPDVVVSEASLSQAISAARKALDDPPGDSRCVRTIRGHGFRFVAEAELLSGAPNATATAPIAPMRTVTPSPESRVVRPPPPPVPDGETLDEPGPQSTPAVRNAHLFVVMHCDAPQLGGARCSLVELDEVEIGRAKSRSAVRNGKVLELGLPDGNVSRQHAKLVRSRKNWLVVDGGSKNGVYVNGERIERAELNDGDVLVCGHTLLAFRASMPTPAGTPLVADSLADERDTAAPYSLIPELSAGTKALARIARSTLPVLVQGESGVGKELAARALHDASGRSGPLVAVDCGALAPASAAGQLFGVLPGAYPGATREEAGFLRAASGGTLLLDEVGSLGGEVQAMLVRSLEEDSVIPLGSTAPVAVDVRIVATTRLSLEELREALRPELLARVVGYVHRVPPLRQRREDFGVLLAAVLDEVAPSSSPVFSVEAGRTLLSHGWPLNVRQLKQSIAASLTLAGDGAVHREHLPEDLTAD